MVEVRDARASDAVAVHDLARVAWHASYDDLIGPAAVDERVDNWYAVDRLRESMADEDDVFLVATEEDEVVGYCHAFLGEESWELGRLYVHPDRWREGIGTALVKRLLADLPEGIDRVRLVVLAENELGRGFYESRGFQAVEERAGEFAPEVVYERVFD